MRYVPPTEADLLALSRRDPALGRALKRVPPYPGIMPYYRRTPHFQSLARSIVYQQLAGAAASAIWNRVLEVHEGKVCAEGVLACSDEDLRGAGLSRAKTRAIISLAEHVVDGRLRLRSIGRLPDNEIVAMLTQVWGVGEWTAQMFLMFKLGRLDVMPVGDLAVREGVRILDGLEERPTPGEVLSRAECWRPLRSVASWVMWRLNDT